MWITQTYHHCWYFVGTSQFSSYRHQIFDLSYRLDLPLSDIVLVHGRGEENLSDGSQWRLPGLVTWHFLVCTEETQDASRNLLSHADAESYVLSYIRACSQGRTLLLPAAFSWAKNVIGSHRASLQGIYSFKFILFSIRHKPGVIFFLSLQIKDRLIKQRLQTMLLQLKE